jgi:hypothetical protein
MTWLKSPWFWLLLLLGIVVVWLLFFRRPAGAATKNQAPQNQVSAGYWSGLLDQIEARFSVGDSMMGDGGGSG